MHFENNGAWKEIENFPKKNRIVDVNGKKINSCYYGPTFRIQEKHEKALTTYEKIARACVGTSMAISSFGFLLCCKSTQNLFKQDKMTLYVVTEITNPNIRNYTNYFAFAHTNHEEMMVRYFWHASFPD